MISGGFCSFTRPWFIRRGREPATLPSIPPAWTSAKNIVLYNQTSNLGGAGILGIDPSTVTVSRTGTAGAIDDRVIVTISGYQYNIITLGWAGTYNGKTITVSMPVEN